MKSALVACLLMASAPAFAQVPPSEADALFDQARALMDANKPAEACPKLERSYELDPGRGTLLNLGACYQQMGRNADALRTFRDVQQQAQAASDQARVDAAALEIATLEKLVVHVQLVVAAPEAPGLVIELDGHVVSAAQRADYVVDLGPLALHASAPGRTSYDHAVALPATPGRAPLRVDVPVLVAPTPATPMVVPPLPPEPMHRARGRVILAGTVAGVGVVAFGASVALAVRAKSDWNTADGLGGRPEISGKRDARHQGNVATVVGIAGIAAVAAGAVVFLTAPRSVREHAPTASITPHDGGLVVQLGGAF